MRQQLRFGLFHAAARVALSAFERRTRNAMAANCAALQTIIKLNAKTEFGYAHEFRRLSTHDDIVSAFRAAVPLSTYADYRAAVDRIAAGERNILSSDPVHMLSGSAGTTADPKRIPRTRRAQRSHLWLVVLAEQAVIDRGIPGATAPERGINLMSLYSPPGKPTSAVPVLSGPNAGMARIKKQIPVFWSAPVEVYQVAHQPTAHYLHALFALANRRAHHIETPFAPQVVSWLNLLERRQTDLASDLATGTLSSNLVLSASERDAISQHLRPQPDRAAEIQSVFEQGFASIVPRLWPEMSYIRTVTSGSFALSLPRLRRLAGPDLPIHSGCHSSSEGVIGINLKTDGSTDYVLACGTAFFEFIPRVRMGEPQPATVDLPDLVNGDEYEIVLTSCAGLYRYRLGDVVRITGHHGTAPTFEYLYRRGTILNLVGEKTTEFHTAQAVTESIERWLGHPGSVKEYTVAGDLGDGLGQYTFFVELQDNVATRSNANGHVGELVDKALCKLNPYYLSNGREAERLRPAQVRFVSPGTFDALLDLQLKRSPSGNATQLKVPRVITTDEQRTLLERHSIAG